MLAAHTDYYMKKTLGKITCAALAAVSALSLAACNTEIPESAFDHPLPWSDSSDSYERLEYSVEVFDTQKSESLDKRVKIGNGSVSFVLNEGEAGGYTRIDTSFTLTYLKIDEAGADAGLTDTVKSTVVFEPKSMAAKSMKKTVKLADRKDTANLSYTVTADYFDAHKATITYTATGKTDSMSLSKNACRDNEMMMYLARAQALSSSSSTNFNMMNIFDSFNAGEPVNYNMAVTGTSERLVDVGEWVKDFGIEKKDADNEQGAAYPVKCITTSIVINATNHGPGYIVLFAKDSFKSGGKEHKKIPVKIDYDAYVGNRPYRHTAYTLTSCSFAKPAQD